MDRNEKRFDRRTSSLIASDVIFMIRVENNVAN